MPTFNRDVADFCGQRDAMFVEEVALGCGLTQKTATLLRFFLDQLQIPGELKGGKVIRAYGNTADKKTKAATSEEIE